MSRYVVGGGGDGGLEPVALLDPPLRLAPAAAELAPLARLIGTAPDPEPEPAAAGEGAPDSALTAALPARLMPAPFAVADDIAASVASTDRGNTQSPAPKRPREQPVSVCLTRQLYQPQTPDAARRGDDCCGRRL